MAVGGALSGAVASGTWEGAFFGAFSGLAFHNIGQTLSASTWAQGDFLGDYSAAGLAAKTVSHGIAGGAITHMQGGRFGHGFLSSGVTAASSPYIATKFDGNRYAQGATAAIVGGTVSSATGGKFANGAVTAAMAYAFNQVASSKRQTAKASEILNSMAEFREAHPDQPIPLSGEELNVLMSVDAEVVRRMYGGHNNETRAEFNERLMAADSPFIGFSGSQIEISGAGQFNGIHFAEDINYYYVGMVTAASDRSWILMHGYIEAYNLSEYLRGQNWHDIRQIPYAKRWARAGYTHYRKED